MSDDEDNVIPFPREDEGDETAAPVPAEPETPKVALNPIAELFQAGYENLKGDPATAPLKWPLPVDGAELANQINEFLLDFVVLPRHANTILTMTVIATYAVHAGCLDHAPRIVITAPDPASGKTTLMEVLTGMVFQGHPTIETTPAQFAVVCNDRETVLLDECHNNVMVTSARRKMTTMIDGGHSRIFAMKETLKSGHNLFTVVCLAGIGDFCPVEIKTRAYEIDLMPKLATDVVRKYIEREEAANAAELRSKLLRWTIDNAKAIRDCRPQLDPVFINREEDNAVALLQIAEIIGAEWANRVREAVHAFRKVGSISDGQVMLKDMAALISDGSIPVYKLPNTGEFLFTEDIVLNLAERFCDRQLYDGFNAWKLSHLLRVYKINSDEQRKPGGRPLRGYHLRHLMPWFERYGLTLAEPEAEPVETATPRQAKAGIAVARAEARHNGRGSDWATPPEIFDPLNAEFGFTLDVCALPWNAKVARYFTPDDDGLTQDWRDEIVFMNCPFGKATKYWMKKAWESAQAGATAACLVPVSPDCPWWHEYTPKGEVRWCEGTVRFIKRDGTRVGTLRPMAVVIFRPPQLDNQTGKPAPAIEPPAIINEGGSAIPEESHCSRCDKAIKLTKYGLIRDHKAKDGNFCQGSKMPPVYH